MRPGNLTVTPTLTRYTTTLISEVHKHQGLAYSALQSLCMIPAFHIEGFQVHFRSSTGSTVKYEDPQQDQLTLVCLQMWNNNTLRVSCNKRLKQLDIPTVSLARALSKNGRGICICASCTPARHSNPTGPEEVLRTVALDQLNNAYYAGFYQVRGTSPGCAVRWKPRSQVC